MLTRDRLPKSLGIRLTLHVDHSVMAPDPVRSTRSNASLAAVVVVASVSDVAVALAVSLAAAAAAAA